MYSLGWCLLDAVLNAIFPNLDREELFMLRAKLVRILLDFLEHCANCKRWAFDTFQHSPLALDSDSSIMISCCDVACPDSFSEWSESLVKVVPGLKNWLKQPPNKTVSPDLWPKEISEFLMICEVLCERNICLIYEYNGHDSLQLVWVDNRRYANWKKAYVFYSPSHYVAGVELE